MEELNPQPLPPGVQLEAFMEAVTRGVLRALEARTLPQASSSNVEALQSRLIRPPIIIGIIIDPNQLEQ